jgi:hypothetical protein
VVLAVAKGSNQMSTRVRTWGTTWYSTKPPMMNATMPRTTKEARAVATYRRIRKTAKKSSAAPRSPWTTTIESAIAHIAIIGARYGRGGRRMGPMRVDSSMRSGRFSER